MPIMRKAPISSQASPRCGMGHKATCAIMCAEAPWWRCHRRIIADHLIAAGESVFHIMGPGRVEPARLTEGAEIGADGRLTYPAPSA